MAIGTPVEFHANSGTSAVTSQAITLPATISVQSAALILVGLNSSQAVNTVATPSGWTLLAGPHDIPTFNNELTYLFTRSVTSAQQGSTVTFTVAGAGVRVAAQGILIPGASASASNIGEFYGTSETSTTLTAPSQTPVVANALHVILSFRRWAAGASPLTTTPPSGFTEFVDDATTKTTNTTGSLFGAWGAYRQLAGQAGVAQGTKTVTLDTPSNGHGYIVTVPPLSSAPTATATSSDVVLIDATNSTPGSGGALTYSIAQTSGPSQTPTLLSSGIWTVTRDLSTNRVYTVTVSEAGGTTATTTVTVNAGASSMDNVEEQLRVGGVWV